MAMGGAASFRIRVGKEFVTYVGWLLVTYGIVAAILVLAAGVPLGGALIVGVIGVPVVAALLAVLSAWAGGADNPDPSSRPYDYDPGSDPIHRLGSGYGASGGWHDYGGPDGGAGDGGAGGGGGGW
jgi:hypothetical protein